MIMGKAAKLSIDSTTKNQKLFVECTALLPVGKKATARSYNTESFLQGMYMVKIFH